jgi:cell division protein FtsB
MNKKILWIGLVAALLLYMFLPGFIRWEKARERLNYYREENRKLSQENLKLKKEIWSLKNDPVYMEETARKELGRSKTGEIIYEIERKESESR